MPQPIDEATPKEAHSRTGFDGNEYELVFSDEFEVSCCFPVFSYDGDVCCVFTHLRICINCVILRAILHSRFSRTN